MGHALIASFGGLPLLYMGDEIGLLNDHGYKADPDLRDDGRWMHRPFVDWTLAARAEADPLGPAGRILQGVKRILAVRKGTDAFAGHVPTRILDTGHPRLLAYFRADDHAPVTCVFNLSEREERVAPWALRLDGPQGDLLSGGAVAEEDGALRLPPYAALWLRPAG
jgi:amylosucrase